MKTGITLLALLVLLAALGLGGFYLYKGYLPGRPPAPPEAPPVTTEAPAPVELPPPTLSGEAPVPAGDAVATLVGMEHTVKAKRAADLSWEEAQARMPLYENDAIRTFEKASAIIAFGPKDTVEVDQNALVVIKPRPKEGQGNEITLALLSGDFLDSLASKPVPEQTQAIQAAAEKRQITIRQVAGSSRPGAATRIAVKTLPDKTTTVAALSGTLKVIGPKGNEITLKEKMVTRITDQGLMVTPRELPGVPEPSFPEDGATYTFQRKVPRAEMKWKPAERAQRYRVVVATDQTFKRIFADERVAGTSLEVRNLQPGTYYWRVRAQDADGFEGAYSVVRSVKAIYDDTPPSLTISAPPEMFVSPAPSVAVKGRTEREARVKINGLKVAVGPDGSFDYPLTLKEGVNLVTIEAVDPAGNSEYGKRVITYKGAKRTSAASVSGNR
jgi:Glucodextranase, domain B